MLRKRTEMSDGRMHRRLQSFKITVPMLPLPLPASRRPLIIYLTVYHRVAVN